MNRPNVSGDSFRRFLGMPPESEWERCYRDYVHKLLSKEYIKWHSPNRNGNPYELFDNRLNCSLLDNRYYALGIYMIWYEENDVFARRTVVYVGEGYIFQRLSAHRNDYDIVRHSYDKQRLFGIRPLYVNFALESSQPRRYGIENYLHDELKPLESSKSSTEQPIPVRLPWECL